ASRPPRAIETVVVETVTYQREQHSATAAAATGGERTSERKESTARAKLITTKEEIFCHKKWVLAIETERAAES
ncbi:hypothetical protein AALO_G00132180, partial [Alosa alosa]